MAYISTDPMAGSQQGSLAQMGLRPGSFGSNSPISTTQPVAGSPPQAAGNLGSLGATSGMINPADPNAGITPTTPAAGTGGGGNVEADIQALAPSLPNGANTNDNKDHTAINALMAQLQAKGYQVQPGLTDEYGRMDSLNINGQIYRVLDSGGNWIAKSNAKGDAWGGTYYGQGDARNSSSGGGMGGFGSLYATVPTEQEAMNMPGIQFALDENNRRMMAGAAAKGTLLNGRTQQAIGQSNIQAALGLGYLPLAQLQNQTKQQNTGNLLDLSKLGLSATSTGNS
jgi:hypothetical protein